MPPTSTAPPAAKAWNTGIQDALNLGWKLALVAQGKSSPELLDSYQAERVPIAEGVLALTHRLVTTFTMASPRKRWLRDHLLPIVMAVPAAERRYINCLGQVSHHYKDSPLSARNAPPAPVASGERLPDVAGMELDGTPIRPLDLLRAGAHTLLVMTGRHTDQTSARRAAAWFAQWGDTVHTITINGAGTSSPAGEVADPYLRAHRRYGALNGRLLLVRPDGYLARQAPISQTRVIEAYLEQLTAVSAEFERETQPARREVIASRMKRDRHLIAMNR